MTAHDRKLQLALAVFGPTVSLGPVVATLLDTGIPVSQIGLILHADSYGRVSDAPGGSPLAGLARNLRPLAESGPSHGILATPRLLAPWQSGSQLPVLWSGETSTAEPRLASDLERQVHAGSVIVAVESFSPREQWRSTRVLLQQDSLSVLAIECSLPAETKA